MQRLTPTPDQAKAIRTMAEDLGPGAINASATGVGKTLLNLEAALERYAKRVLIAAPLSTFDNWRDTLYGQTEGSISLRPVGNSKVSGDTTAKECKKNLEDMLAGKDGYYFISRELLVSLDWHTVEGRRKQKHIYKKHPFDVFIGDEAHAWCNKNSRGYKTFASLPADYKIAASATWFGSSFEYAYGLPSAIWGKDFTDTFALWKVKWCATKYTPFTYDKMDVTGEKVPGAWASSLPTFVQILSDIENPEPEIRWVDLSPAEMKVYKDLDYQMAAKVESGEWILAENSAIGYIRLRQATLGPLDVDPETFQVSYDPEGNSSKYAELKRMLKEHDEQVLVVTDSAKFAQVVTDWLKRDGYTAGLWAGLSRTSAAERDALKASFLASETRIIVMVIAAGGVGTDKMQNVCRRMIILSDDQSETRREQVFGRLARKGQQREVIIQAIYARHTVDAGVGETLLNKAILNTLSRRSL